MSLERVQKILAQAGITSRRKAEELILEGSVTINGQVAKLGDKAEFGKDAIKVSGKLLQAKEAPIYLALNKPRGVVSTMSDPESRPCLATYLGKIKGRIFPIGRLDFNSDGLIILTNDGALAERVQKATNILRVYHVKVKGRPDATKIARLEKGARIGARLVQPHSVRLAEELPSKVVLEVAFNDPGAIDVKQLFEQKGLLVDKITRTAIGHLTLRGMGPGQYRLLQASQIDALVAQPELGMRRLEMDSSDDGRNAEGGFEYRRPSRALEQKERRRQATSQASESNDSDESAKPKRIVPRDEATDLGESDELPSRSTLRPSGIRVRKKGEGDTRSFGKPRSGFGSRSTGERREGSFEKRGGFGSRSTGEKREGSFEKRGGFGSRSTGERREGSFEKRGGFGSRSTGEKREGSFEKRSGFGSRSTGERREGSFEKRGGFGSRSTGERREGSFEKRSGFGSRSTGERREGSFEKRGGFGSRSTGERREGSFEKRGGFGGHSGRPSFGKKPFGGGDRPSRAPSRGPRAPKR